MYVQEGDPERPVWGVSGTKFTINGRTTTVSLPSDVPSAKRSAAYFNDMGFGYKIVNGQYYMNATWWCTSQVSAGRIVNYGGNRNSIGIETAVNQGSDLWLTWHYTAQLVARLMITYNLPIERVVGHHFFTAKDCPQPLLENELELWWRFIECVKTEYAILTELEGATVSMALVGEYENVTENGRVTAGTSTDEFITYDVTVTTAGGVSTTVRLTSLLKAE